MFFVVDAAVDVDVDVDVAVVVDVVEVRKNNFSTVFAKFCGTKNTLQGNFVPIDQLSD